MDHLNQFLLSMGRIFRIYRNRCQMDSVEYFQRSGLRMEEKTVDKNGDDVESKDFEDTAEE
jgi:hypothetical protein